MIPERSRLLLEACLGPSEDRLESWRRWLQLTRFDDIDLGSFELLPSVYHLNRGRPFPEMDRLKGVFRHNWAVNQGRVTAALPLLAALQEEGLNPVPIKGLSLALTTYGSLGARRMADVDVLVPADKFPRAAEIAKKKGFLPTPPFTWPRASVKSWGFNGPDRGEVDLHARPCEEPWDAGTEALMRAHPRNVEFSGLRLSALSPSSDLMLALLHGLRFDGRGGLRWMVDAGLLAQGGLVDWDLVDRVSRRWGVAFAVSAGLRQLRPFLGDRVLPEGLLARRPFAPRERIEHAFRGRAPGGFLGALPNLYFLFARERAVGLWSGSFGGFLREAWQVPREQALGPILVRKLFRRVASSWPAP